MAANVHMDQSIASASTLLDEVEITLRTLAATHPTQPLLGARDAAFEAVRKAFCKLQRYSFSLDSRGNMRRCADHSGNWVEFEAAHTLFEPQSVDAAIAQEGWCDGCSPDNCVGCGPAAPAQVQPEPNREQS